MTFRQYVAGPAAADGKTFRVDCGPYTPDSPLNKMAYLSCGFGRLQGSGGIEVLDAMSGPGKFGKMLLDNYQQANNRAPICVSFNDVRTDALAGLSNEGFRIIGQDIRKLDTDSRFDIVVERFGLKDLGLDGIQEALAHIRAVLSKGGRLVVADMTAHSRRGQEGINRIHAKEQNLLGRNEVLDGSCFIPTNEDWKMLLDKSGFEAHITYSKANAAIPLNLVKQRLGQNSEGNAKYEQLYRTIADEYGRNPQWAREFRVHMDSRPEMLTITYPYIVLTGKVR